MNVTVVGAGNSGLAMAAHLSQEGNNVTLWNRSKDTISKLMNTHTIQCEGVVEGAVRIRMVTDNLKQALQNPDLILITTPAYSHKMLAELIGKNIRRETIIILNPGRTFGALEFKKIYERHNNAYSQLIAETQTTIYTSRKTEEDEVNIIALKDDVLVASLDPRKNVELIKRLPECLQEYFVPASSIIETSIGNVGMVLHCAPLLLNAGWTENKKYVYKYYYEGITPTIASFLEQLDEERVSVAEGLGLKVESTKEWLKRTYHVEGANLYECIHNNEAYNTIDAPSSLVHRYIFEDVPCGLVPLEAMGRRLGLEMIHTTLIVDLASRLLNVDFRSTGRNLDFLDDDLDSLFKVLERGA